MRASHVLLADAYPNLPTKHLKGKVQKLIDELSDLEFRLMGYRIVNKVEQAERDRRKN